MKTLSIFLLLTFLLVPSVTFAHPGGLDGNDCHHCWTNCEEKYGIPSGDYHCHPDGDKTNYVYPVAEEKEEPEPIIEEVVVTETNDEPEVTAPVIDEPITEPEAETVSINREDIDVTDLPLPTPDDTVIGIVEPMEIEFEDLSIEETNPGQEAVETIGLTKKTEPVDMSTGEAFAWLGVFLTIIGGILYGFYRGVKTIIRKLLKK